MFTVRLLGAVEIEKNGISRPYGARKYAALLALLALNPNRVFSRSELVATLWPDSNEERGRGALRTALSALRAEFTADTLVTTPETVSLAAGMVTTDVAQLEQAVRQIERATTIADATEIFVRLQALYRGQLLPGRYDDWIVAERARVDDLLRGAQARHDILHRSLQKEWPPERAPASARPRLPLFGTRFLGRDNEADALCALLSDRANRLVTLTGTGGVGKTRLAVEVAHRLAGRFCGAVCFVPLAACTDGEEILGEVAQALSSEPLTTQDWEATIARRLQRVSQILIVLDNAEQLVGSGAGDAVRRLQEIAPAASLLVTSRQILAIEGERNFPLHGLGDAKAQLLFVEQAQCIRPDFALTDANQEAVGQLCAELDGIPLAIQLCAAWISVLTPQQILGKMENRFSLLKSRRQDGPARHRSLHAALEWGCPTEPELLAFFLALSVFRGGFTLEAAEVVAGRDALEHLATLRDHSLLVAEIGDKGAMRYRLLETIREFADEKLTGDARTMAQGRHLAYFHHLAGSVTPLLSGTDTEQYFAALELENPNFRAAIERALDKDAARIATALETIQLLTWYWQMRGHRMPIRPWLDKAFVRRDELPEAKRAVLLMDYANHVSVEQAMELCSEALSLFEAMNSDAGIAKAYERLGHLHRRRGDLEGVVSCLRKSAALQESLGEIRGSGYVLADLAGTYFLFGDLINARLLWKQCREISESLGDVGSVAVLDRAEALGRLQESRAEEALPLLENAIATFRSKGEKWQLMDTLHRYGEALAGTGRREPAIEALSEAASLAQLCGDTGRAERIRNFIATV